MANTLDYGTSSPQIAAFQKMLKQSFGYNVPTDGSFDDKTLAAVNDLGAKIGVGRSVEKVDAQYMAAVKTALVPRTKVVIRGKEYWVTKEQLATLKARAGATAADSVQPYVNMAKEVQLLWKAHDDTRKKNWFWANAVDLATGCKFPDKSTVDAALRAAESMQAKARACALTPQQIGSESAPIRTAFAAMDQYREELFGGGAELIKNLELIRDSCVVVLEVSAAVATGGASWQVQVGVAAGLAAYKQALAEVDTASKTANYNVESGVARVFMAAVIDGSITYVLKGTKAGPLLDKVTEQAIKKAGTSMVKVYVIKAVKGGGQKMLEDGLKGLTSLADPSKQIKFDDVVKAAATSFISGAGVEILGPVCAKYGAKASKNFSPSDFKGLGKNIDLDKAGEEGVKKAIDAAATPIVQKKIDGWSATANHDKFEAELRSEILADPKVRKAAETAMASKDKKK